jgi:hypothetical protein
MKRLIVLLFVLAACAKERVAPPTPAANQKSAGEIAGATQYVRDPHSYARPEDVRVEHIALDLTVDFA